MISATISPCAIARCASIGSPVTSPMAQTSRIEVRHWSSMRTKRPSMSSASSSQAPAFGERPPADGDEHLVGRQMPARRRPRSRPAAPCRRRRARSPCAPVMHLDAELGQPARHRPGQLGVVERQDAVLGLDHRDLGAELGEGGAELEPDIAGADDDQPFRHLGQRQRLGRGDHRAAERQRSAARPAPSRWRARRARR